jgi:AcrR family transcriptional regulator
MVGSVSEQRRAEILDAVLRVIIDIGYTEMTVGDVARQAGVSNALVHYHFSSKAALITAALRAASDDDKELRDSFVESGGTATARLDRMLRASLPESTDTDASWLLWIETWGETRRSVEIREVMAELNEHERSAIVALVGEGIDVGEFECDDPDGVARRLMALRDGMAIEHTLFQSDRPATEMTLQLRAALRNNLGLADAEFAALVES